VCVCVCVLNCICIYIVIVSSPYLFVIGDNRVIHYKGAYDVASSASEAKCRSMAAWGFYFIIFPLCCNLNLIY